MAKKTTKTTKKETKTAAATPETKVAAEAKTEEVVKEDVKKTATASKKKAAPKKAETVSSISHFFEIDGEQISTSDIEEKIREAYKAEGHRIGNMKEVSVYYNFAERRAYYVVNGKAEDKFIKY